MERGMRMGGGRTLRDRRMARRRARLRDSRKARLVGGRVASRRASHTARLGDMRRARLVGARRARLVDRCREMRKGTDQIRHKRGEAGEVGWRLVHQV